MPEQHITETKSVRITMKRYRELRRIAKANGHTISWLMNYALDLYFQGVANQARIAELQAEKGQTA